MESHQFTKTIELKSLHGPIKIERLQPQHKTSPQHGQMSYSLTRNCTSLNLQFISVQKMDNVLHSIQRRIYKQKEERVFAEFIKSNYASTQSKSHFVQIDSGQVCFERGSKETVHCRNGSTKVHASSDTRSSSNPRECLSNENYMMKELVDELKMCIATLNTSANRGNNVRFNSGDKSSFHQEMDKKVMAVARKSHTMQNRPKNTYPLGKKTVQRPQHLKKVEHKPKKLALKIKSPADKNLATEFAYNMKSIVLAKNTMQDRQILPIKNLKRTEESPEKALDALALWKSLSKMEKVEELVRRNLEMMNADENRQVKAMEKKENVADIQTNAISPGNFGTSTSLYELGNASSANGSRCKLDTKDMNTKAPTRSHDYRFGHANMSSTRFLAPNSDIVAEIKKLSNSLVDELLNEVSNEILDLPETFLMELLETEFANNNTHTKVG